MKGIASSVNNDGGVSNVNDKEEVVEVRREKTVAAKIKAFEALVNAGDTQKPANWWLGQRNNEEYIRESILFTSPVYSIKKKAPLTPIIDDEDNTRDLPLRFTNQILSNGDPTISPSFASVLNQTLLSNATRRSIPNGEFLTSGSYLTMSSSFISKVTQEDATSLRPKVPKRPDKVPGLKINRNNSLYEDSDAIASHRNSLYSNNNPLPARLPRRLSNDSLKYKTDDPGNCESNIYEEIVFKFKATTVLDERRASVSSTSSVPIPLPEKNQM